MVRPNTSLTKAAAKMKKSKSVKSIETGESSPGTPKANNKGTTLNAPVHVLDDPSRSVEPVETSKQTGTSSSCSDGPQVPADVLNNSTTDVTLNDSSAATAVKKSPPRRDPSKPSSNFTPIERTFILMAISAVRADPKWRKHEEADAVKDFSVPFCNAVRQKLFEDPDFKGKVAVASATPDREGKCKQSPSKESIRKIWTNLYVKGSITRDFTNMGRKKDTAAEERVKQYLQLNPDCKMSSRAIAAQTNTSNRNVIRILRQENLAIRKTKFRRPGAESVKKKTKPTAKTKENSVATND